MVSRHRFGQKEQKSWSLCHSWEDSERQKCWSGSDSSDLPAYININFQYNFVCLMLSRADVMLTVIYDETYFTPTLCFTTPSCTLNPTDNRQHMGNFKMFCSLWLSCGALCGIDPRSPQIPHRWRVLLQHDNKYSWMRVTCTDISFIIFNYDMYYYFVKKKNLQGRRGGGPSTPTVLRVVV